MDLLVTKDRVGALRAADEASAESIKTLAPGEVYRVVLTRPRNVKMHRLFFALLTVVHANLSEGMLERFPTVERLLWEIKIQVGHFDLHETLGGKMVPIPKSIAFSRMDQAEFDRFFSDAISVVRKFVIPGISERELRDAIDEEIGRYG